MTLINQLLRIHRIQSDVLDISKSPNFIKFNHANTTFDKHFYRPGFVHQIDTLYLPTDESGYKFLLVNVDIGSGIMDCRPLKQLTADAALKALQNIYGLDGKKQNKIFSKPPLRIHADKGSEYNNKQVINFFHSKNIGLRFASTGRHSQQAVVERMNLTIGKVIMQLQLHNENVTGEEDKDWLQYIPDIVKEINKHAKETKPPPPPQDDNADIKCNGTECEILEVGSQVRVALDYPTDVNGKRLYGNFRAGDRRFSLKPHTIANVLMFPNQPIRYVVDGIKNNTFSKAELMPYVAPKGKQLANGKFFIEKIIDMKKERNTKYYLVKWDGYDDSYNTWEAKKKLVQEGHEKFISEFEKTVT